MQKHHNTSRPLILSVQEACGLILLRAQLREFPITMVELSQCMLAFAAENHPVLVVNIDSPMKPEFGGYYFDALGQYIGALEEFGSSTRLAMYTLLTEYGVDNINNWYGDLCDWRARSPIHRRALSRFRRFVDRYIAHLQSTQPRTVAEVAPCPSLAHSILVNHYA